MDEWMDRYALKTCLPDETPSFVLVPMNKKEIKN